MKKFLSGVVFLGLVGFSFFPGTVGAEVSDPMLVRALQDQVASLIRRVSELQTQLQGINNSTVPTIYQSAPSDYTPPEVIGSGFLYCGDTNMDGKIAIDDATGITNYIFSGGSLPAGVTMSDVDGNGRVDISDSVYIINYINNNGPAPKCMPGVAVPVQPTIPVGGSQSNVVPLNQFQASPDVTPVDNGGVGPKFSVGQVVRTTDYLNVRDQANGRSIIVKGRGTTATILSGPVLASGYYWWQLEFNDAPIGFTGTRGWSVQNWLEKTDNWVNASQVLTIPPAFTDDSFVSPISVGANRSNWWLLKALDKDSSKLFYKVFWGDGAVSSYEGLSGQGIKADHTYASPGNYVLKAEVADDAGNVFSRQLSVEVLNPTNLTPSTKFSIGDNVKTSDAVNVRTHASGVVVKTMPMDSDGRVVGGPVWGIAGDWWWNIQYKDGTEGWSAETWLKKFTASEQKPYFVCADVNNDGVVNTNDANKIQEYIFSGGSLPAGRGDVDGNGMINISDSVYVINYVSAGGANPKCGVPPINEAIPEQPVQKVNPQPTMPANPTPELKPLACGDLNLDGKITNEDANVITKYIFNGGSLPAESKADVDGNGTINISDATAIVNYINVGTALRCSTSPQTQFSCGDTNMDGKINNDDATVITNYIFSGGTLPAGATMSDADGNGRVDISDAVYVVNYVNSNGPAPRCQAAQAGSAAASVLNTTGGQLDSILSKFQNLIKSLR